MAKPHTSLIVLVPLILCVVFALSASISHADVIQQTIYSTSIGQIGISAGPIPQTGIYLPPGTSGYVSGVSVYLNSLSCSVGSPCRVQPYLLEGTSTNFIYTSGTGDYYFNGNSNIGRFVVSDVVGVKFSTTTPLTKLMDASKYYFLGFRCTSGCTGEPIIQGASTVISGNGNTYLAGALQTKTIYYQLNYAGGVTDLQPQVYDISSPTQFQVTTSNYVPVIFTYLSSADYDLVGVQVIDQSNNGLLLDTLERTADYPSIQGFSDILSLSSNHAYRIRGYLKDSTGAKPTIYGAYRDFSTVSDQFFTSSSTLINIVNITDSNATSTASIATNSFSNILGFFADRVPFGWLWQINDIYRETATSSSEFAGVTFDFGSSNISTSTRTFLPGSLEVLSTTSVTHYLSPGLLSTFNALASAILYVGTLGGVFFRVKGLAFQS